jgi:hypothetical protein
MFKSITEMIPGGKKSEFISFSDLSTFLNYFKIEYFQPDLAAVIVTLSENGNCSLGFQDF